MAECTGKCSLTLVAKFLLFYQYRFGSYHMLVSYDVVSLSTNIPLSKTMDIVCNYVYQQHSPPKYSKETF